MSMVIEKAWLHKASFHLYMMLFPAAYLVLLNNHHVVWPINILILAASYYLIIFKDKYEPILYLMMFSRCVNGFMVPGNSLSWTAFNALTSYLPLLIMVVRERDNIYFGGYERYVTRKYRFTVIYLVMLLCYSLIDISLSAWGIAPRILPMVMFLASCFIIKDRLDYSEILVFFRYIFVAMLFAYVATDYITVSSDLLDDGIVFKQSIGETQYFMVNEYFRNMGIFWDNRILGIFSYLYLYISLMTRDKLRYFDIPLSLVVMVTTFSRGAMVVGLMILLPLFILSRKGTVSIVKVSIIALIIAAVLVLPAMDIDSPIWDFVKTFNLFSEEGAVSERSVFRDYAVNTFIEHPQGMGVGYLKSPAKIRYLADIPFTSISDAFWFILPAEIGILGLLFFVLSSLEILAHRNIYSILLLAGYSTQLIGTDVPDMGIYYFMFLVLIANSSSLISRNEPLTETVGC